MSRNLCTSSCCGNIVRLSDLRGKPIEFRKMKADPPNIGTRWDCPTYKTAYFVFWRDAKFDDLWGRWSSGFVLDLSYYESFNDEHGDPEDFENPQCQCLDDAEDFQWVW